MGGDLTQVLRRPVELAGISGHSGSSVRCPLYPQKRTWAMSGSRVAGLQGSGDGVGGSNRIAVWFYGKVARERVIVLIYQSERKYA
jgi:hypothetical protein